MTNPGDKIDTQRRRCQRKPQSRTLSQRHTIALLFIDPEVDAERDSALQPQRACLQNTQKQTRNRQIQKHRHVEESVSTERYTRVWVHAWTHTNTHTRDHEPLGTPRPRIPRHTCKYLPVHTTDQAQTHTGTRTQLCHRPMDHTDMQTPGQVSTQTQRQSRAVEPPGLGRDLGKQRH